MTRKILINDRLARVHMVEGMLFLVSPEIFKLYVQSTTGSTDDGCWRKKPFRNWVCIIVE